MSIPAGLYLREAGGLRNINTGELRASTVPPPAAPDAFTLGTTEPTATNTGLSNPGALTVLSGNVTLSTPGQVFENRDVYGKVSITAADVTVRNCILRGNATGDDACVNAANVNVRRAVIERCLIAPQTPTYNINGINGHDFTARRNHVRDVVDAFGLFNTHAPTGVGNPFQLAVTLEGNYVERVAYYSPDPNQPGDNQSHNDVVQIHGGFGVVIRGNAFHAVYGPAGTHQPPLSGPTPSWSNPSLAAILLNNRQGGTGGHTITDNWFYGAYVPLNLAGAGTTADLGTAHRNRFDGTSGFPSTPKATIWRSAGQVLDAGVGTANQNVFFDGTPITVRTNA